MDALKRSDFFEHFKGQVFLSQYQAIAALDPETAARGDLAPLWAGQAR